MPDGTIIKDVPEGTTKAQLTARLQKAQAMTPDMFRQVKAEGNRPPPPMFTPSGEKPELSYSNPDVLRGHPLVRAAEGAASPFIGAGQLAANLLGQGAPVNEFLAESQKRADMARQLLGSEGADFWKLGGTILSPAVLAAMRIPTAGTFGGRAAQGAGVGAAFGAASPVEQADDYWKRKGGQVAAGATIGAVIPPTIDLVSKGATIARNIVDPLLPGGPERGAARIIAEAVGPKRAAVEAELARAQTLVPGSQPTAAEAAAAAGSPELSALQRIAGDIRPSAYTDIRSAQEAARLAAVRGVGQTPADLQAAQAIRSISGRQNYGAVVNDMIATADPTVQSLLARPSMKEALKRAKALAEESGSTFGDPASGLTVGNMQSVKMALDDLVKNPERFGIGASEVNAINRTRAEFLNWLGKQSPGWERARQVYATQSKPINEMQVGQQLEKALTKPVGEGERASAFGTAMREAPSTIKKATGNARFDELGDVLQPQNLATVKSVLADLSRKIESDRLAPMGMARATEAAKPFGLPATGPLQQGYMIFKTVLGRVSKGINEKTLDTMADALQVPAETLRLLQSAPTQQRQALINHIISAKLGRGTIAASSEMSGEGISTAR